MEINKRSAYRLCSITNSLLQTRMKCAIEDQDDAELSRVEKVVAEVNTICDDLCSHSLTNKSIHTICCDCGKIIKHGCCGHDSDCAVHNAPAIPIGECDCL